jgi:hypothetical protein
MKTRPIYFIIGLTFMCLELTAGYSRVITSREATIVTNQQLVKLGRQTDFTLEEIREIMKDGVILAYAFDLEPTGYMPVYRRSLLILLKAISGI